MIFKDFPKRKLFCGPFISQTQVQLWYNLFKKGQEDVNERLPVLISLLHQQPMKSGEGNDFG